MKELKLDRQLQRLRESNSKVLTSTRYDSYSENMRKKDTVKDHDVRRDNVENGTYRRCRYTKEEAQSG
ncbi:hypothetical protein DPMN_157455 [Dreissena polymorpha]|uniref:Uncharacterized protein n=1 Tax=Dreissena polymorpha TaxID=45954 RepID=A0A9D4INV8_DREPO|nr:hypothetical protein DPMN_157452 [Dreissena polymorpha]KAH3779650.1 hypothetical protein DPMN_157455 [Dreissena polymorpha]